MQGFLTSLESFLQRSIGRVLLCGSAAILKNHGFGSWDCPDRGGVGVLKQLRHSSGSQAGGKMRA